MAEHNWHAIIGPNGMCECGVRADGTVVTCGALLREHVEASLASAALEIEQLKAQIDHLNTKLAIARDRG